MSKHIEAIKLLNLKISELVEDRDRKEKEIRLLKNEVSDLNKVIRAFEQGVEILAQE